MNRRISLGMAAIILLLVLCGGLSGCKENQPPWMSWPESPAEDFQYTVSTDGNGIWLEKYIGSGETVVIPAEIDGLPVTRFVGVRHPDSSNGLIAEGVFEGNTAVKEVVLPNTLTHIGMSAFLNCSDLTHVYIPADSALEVIGDSAFNRCVALQSMDLSSTRVWMIADYAFQFCSALTEFRFPNTLTEIRRNAFEGCSALSEAHLPDNLTTIGDDAFARCESLKRVTIPPRLEMDSWHTPLFYGVPALEQIIFTEGRETLVGVNMIHITSEVEVVIPKGVTKFSGYLLVTDGKIPVRLKFLGDCPQLVLYENGTYDHYTVYYDPAAKGWENSVWTRLFTMNPIE